MFDQLSDDEIMNCLTGVTLAIAETVSLKTAVKLTEEYGGCGVTIPVNYSASHKLGDLLGEDEFRKLVHFFKGENLDIPIARSLKSKIRNKAIFQAKESGLSTNEIARRFHLTARAVRNIIQAARSNNTQSTTQRRRHEK